ncbi:energy transducer TonB [Bradyrhizobium sp. AZCC 1719]|uniref:energy transducer TonB n=1 Tax=Bradyrhizobium sp. AZCC 1719 TaxID=3117028 RepID=UPI003FA5D3F7
MRIVGTVLVIAFVWLQCTDVVAARKQTLPADYVAELVRRLNISKVYPYRANADCRVRMALVRFNFDKDGALTFVRVVKSSGLPDFDRAAVMTVQRAQPFPPRPAGVSKSSFGLPLVLNPLHREDGIPSTCQLRQAQSRN